MVMVIPVYEMEIEGVYYNTAAVVDADGTYLGKFRKIHIPHTWPGFWEKFYFKRANMGFPIFETASAKIGIYICYDRHFPECARALALKGAEILFNPSATTAGKSQYLWQLEQPAQAVANGVFIGANNRVGLEKLHFTVHGVHAQNYHIFTPPGDRDWTMVWGGAQWVKDLPYALAACSGDVMHSISFSAAARSSGLVSLKT